jgi:hypothetical protein
MSNPVATPNAEYTAVSKNWHLTASLRGGTPAMRAAGKTYLPQEPAESDAAYQNRIARAVLTNLYKKTCDKLVGKPLKKPIVAGEDIPADVLAYWDDIDNQGTNADVFARNLLEAAVDDGVTHVFVDMTEPTAPGQMPDGRLTLAQQQEQGIRPFARHVRAKDLIGWKSEMRNGSRVLTQIRIAETAKKDVDAFNQAIVERIRVVEPFLQTVYEKTTTEDGKKEDWVIVETKTTTMPVIPLVTFYTNRTGFMCGEPWLLDIAHLNVRHWQSDSDQQNILHVARVPILFAQGLGDDETQTKIEIGSNTFIRGPKGSDLKYVEHTGKGVEAGAKELKDLEERIQLLGLEMLVKRPTGNTTATARALDQAEADSRLGLVSKELENALESLLDFFALWLDLGDDAGGSVTVFKDFSIGMQDAADIGHLLKARALRDITRQTFLTEMKRRGLLADDFDIATEIDLLDVTEFDQPPPSGVNDAVAA